MTNMRETGGYIDGSQSGYAYRGRGDKQSVDKRNPVRSGVRQRQQPGPDQYHEHETEQEKQRGLDPCLHQRERLPG